MEFDALKLENQICFPLYACSKEIIKKYRPFLDEINLTYTQYITMMILWEEKIISLKEIGKKICQDLGGVYWDDWQSKARYVLPNR